MFDDAVWGKSGERGCDDESAEGVESVVVDVLKEGEEDVSDVGVEDGEDFEDEGACARLWRVVLVWDASFGRGEDGGEGCDELAERVVLVWVEEESGDDEVEDALDDLCAGVRGVEDGSKVEDYGGGVEGGKEVVEDLDDGRDKENVLPPQLGGQGRDEEGEERVQRTPPPDNKTLHNVQPRPRNPKRPVPKQEQRKVQQLGKVPSGVACVGRLQVVKQTPRASLALRRRLAVQQPILFPGKDASKHGWEWEWVGVGGSG